MSIDEYILSHISPEPEWLTQIDRLTHLRLLNPRMCSGHLQGRLLKQLVAISGAKKVLELGTFSGYSALCIAEGLPQDGVLHTIEVDDELEDFIQHNLALSPHGHKVQLHIGHALPLIQAIEPDTEFDMIFVDADKREYPAYYAPCMARLRVGGLLIADNTLWDGHVVETHPRSSQTAGVIEFNDMAARDPHAETVIIPLRDGLSVIRKLA